MTIALPTTGDPLFRAGNQFPLGRLGGLIEPVDAASSGPGVRPFGLRFATATAAVATVDMVGLRYDPARQLSVDETGVPVFAKHSTGHPQRKQYNRPERYTIARLRLQPIMITTEAPPRVSENVFVGWHTSASDGYSHAVTEAAFGDGIRRRLGQFHTVCGQVIHLAASTAPCGRPCPACAALLPKPACSQPADDDTDYDMVPSDWPYSKGAHEAFAALRKSGFTHYCCGDRRAPHLLVSTYDWDGYGYVDVINIRGLDRVTAARILKYDGLDIFAPAQAVWHYMGALEPTVTAMLRLLPPHYPDAPTVPYPAPLTLFVSSREQRPMTIKPGNQA